MEELLCDAALKGELEGLIEKHEYILDKVLMGCFKGKNPLHLAILTKQVDFALKLLQIKPKLAKVLDTDLRAALHIASADGGLKIVEALVKLSPEMCMARDRDGYNPLHIAAMEGKVDVLKMLYQTCPRAALVRVDGGNTILHLCVSRNQLESLRLLLKMIKDPEFADSQDANGNTILHIAVFDKRLEIVKHLLTTTEIEVNALNKAQWTAMDIWFFGQNRPHRHQEDVWIEQLLRAAGASRLEDLIIVSPIPERVEKLWQTLMVVSSLFATMAFQVGVNPPGDVWQDNSGGHIAGKAILAYKYPQSYSCFMYFNTVGFLSSLSLITFLLLNAMPFPKSRVMWSTPVLAVLTILTTGFAYAYSTIVVSPKHTRAVSNTILASVIVWAFLMLLLVIMFVATFESTRPKKDRERMSKLARDMVTLPPNAVDENVSSA